MTRSAARLGLVALVALVSGVLFALVSTSTPVESRPVDTGHAGRSRPASPAHPIPRPLLKSWVHLPILDYIGDGDACSTWLEVQAAGGAPMKAVLWTWGEPGFCPPQEAGPLTVECTGLIKPGATWVMSPDLVQTGSRSGVLFKLSARRLSDDGLELIFGFDDTYADFVCDQLFYAASEDPSSYRRFREAIQHGGTFEGIPMDLASGRHDGGMLAVEVVRECSTSDHSGSPSASRYSGIASHQLGTIDPAPDSYARDRGHMYYLPLIRAHAQEAETYVYAQNGGLSCASLELWLKPENDSTPAQLCETAELAAAETITLHPSSCVGEGWRGAGWIRADQPMAVVVDVMAPNSLMTYTGRTGELTYVFDPDFTIYPPEAIATAVPCVDIPVEPGNRALSGPLVYSGHRGWDSTIHVQNMSPSVPAKVRITCSEGDGSVVATLVDWIGPSGSRSLSLGAVHALPPDWVGSVVVENLPWSAAEGPDVEPSGIAGIVAMSTSRSSDGNGSSQAIAYSMLPEYAVFDWPEGASCGGIESGIGLVAIPSLVKGSAAGGTTSEIAIANVVPIPGFTAVAVHIYDQNGFMQFHCEDLYDRQTAYIDLDGWGFLGPGFRGSAIVSAWFWEHDLFDEDGRFVRSMVGLGAVSVMRDKATGSGESSPDASTGSPGIPLSRRAVLDSQGGVNLATESIRDWCWGFPTICPAP